MEKLKTELAVKNWRTRKTAPEKLENLERKRIIYIFKRNNLDQWKDLSVIEKKFKGKWIPYFKRNTFTLFLRYVSQLIKQKWQFHFNYSQIMYVIMHY